MVHKWQSYIINLHVDQTIISGDDDDENAEELQQPLRPARSDSNTPIHSGNP